MCLVVVLIGALAPVAAADTAAPADCIRPDDRSFAGFNHRLVVDVDTNTSSLEVGVADTSQRVCSTRIALASYRAQSTERSASLPQELFEVASGELDGDHPTLRLLVPMAACQPFQVDALFVGEHNLGLLPTVDMLHEHGGPMHDYFDRLIAIGFNDNHRSRGTASLVAGGRTWSPTSGVSWWFGQAGCRRDSPAEVPFEQMGKGWLLSLIQTDPNRPQLAVIGPDQSTYVPDIAATDQPMTEILDWRPDGTEAIVRLGGTNGTGGRVAIVSLVDGSVRPFEADVAKAGFTRPLGTDVVAMVRDGTGQHLELRNGATVKLGSYPADDFGLPWLYSPDGRSLVVGDRFGVGFTAGHLTRWANDGTELNQLDSAATSCSPVRWWDRFTVLAACTERPGQAPYSRLWLVPADGGTAFALTPAAEDAVAGAELGFSDAHWVSPTALALQGEGTDAPMLFRRQPDGTPTPLRLLGVPSRARLVRAGGGRLILWDPDAIMFEPPLITTRLDGDALSILRREAVRPVLDVVSNDPGPATVVDGERATLDPLPPFESAPGLSHGGNKGLVCPAPDTDRIPGALDADADGAPEHVRVSDRDGAQPGGIVAEMVEFDPTGTVVHGSVAVSIDILTRSASWYGDLNGDGLSEAVACVQGASGSGHPLGALVVFSPARGTWRLVLAHETGGRPVSVEAKRDGLVGLFESATLAGVCRETTRQTFGWRGDVLELTAFEVVSRHEVLPADFPGPVTCPWESSD